ncbi:MULTISPECIES: hypothetical protein [Campylobacter]|uniref:hypothetical protein n=1 Tax=Campylobacter TaxID=194 RepID=UPI000A356E37|nr:hypothetical protein [Campylobacter sp. P0024]MCR8678505.1 hypothetical protein [Campylobacter sp. RM19072]MEE3704141.1 hypothetical protein [Campylobacter sp. CX2-8023-23]
MRILHFILPCFICLSGCAQNIDDLSIQSYNIEVDFMDANEHNKRDIMLGYNDILHDVQIDSNSDNLTLIISGKTAINRVKFDEISSKIAQYLKNHREQNKIAIEYHLDSKKLFKALF